MAKRGPKGTQTVKDGKKKCSKCGELKPLGVFDKNKKTSSRHASSCKQCLAEDRATPETKQKKKESNKEYRETPENKQKKKEWSATTENKQKRKERHNERYKTEPKFRLNENVSRGIRNSLNSKGGSKNGYHWKDLVGYTESDLVKHLEKQFVNGMTWENYGEWHIDHVCPISKFNFTDPSHTDFKRCWSLKNLQPLWAFDNISKKDKLEKPFQPSLAL